MIIFVGMPHWAKAAGIQVMASTKAMRAGADLQFLDLMVFLLGRGICRLHPEAKRVGRGAGNEEKVKTEVKFR